MFPTPNFFVILLASLPLLLPAQDHNWWANNVQWDGKSHWSTYITSSARYLGPNALPVPALPGARVQEDIRVQLSGQVHIAPGDQTVNPALRLYYPFKGQQVALELFWVPLEYFNTSHEWKTERKVFHRLYDAHAATGDVHLSTLVQVLKQENAFADVLFRLGYRYASSNRQGAARFTDAPGYWFDVSLGKEWGALGGRLRLEGMGGLYVWQTNRDDRLQNDAFLGGLSLGYRWKSWRIQTAFRGYWGYIGHGDDPLALSLHLYRDWPEWTLFAGLQAGMGDLLYDSLELGFSRRLFKRLNGH